MRGLDPRCFTSRDHDLLYVKWGLAYSYIRRPVATLSSGYALSVDASNQPLTYPALNVPSLFGKAVMPAYVVCP